MTQSFPIVCAVLLVIWPSTVVSMIVKNRSHDGVCAICPTRSLTCCPAGEGGRGGCYQPPGESCCSGKICSNPRKCCPAGANGNGGCIQEPKETCCSGKVCRSGFSCCPAGSAGVGGCFVEYDKKCCSDGTIIQKNKQCS